MEIKFNFYFSFCISFQVIYGNVPVPENCLTLAQHIIAKKDWSKDAIGDIKTIVQTDLSSIFVTVKKHVTDLESEYITLVQQNENTTSDTKNQLIIYVKKIVNDSVPSVDQMAETSYNIFATANSRDVELLNSNSNLFINDEKLNEHIEKLREYITKGCLNIIKNIKIAEFESERAIQNQLIQNNISVPQYIYVFHPSVFVPLIEELDDDEEQLINSNKVNEAVSAIVDLAQDLLDGIIKDIDIDVSNAHKALTVNIAANSQLIADEKAVRLKNVEQLTKQYEDNIKNIKIRIMDFIASKRAETPDNLIKYLEKVSDEAAVFGTEINNYGETFFNDITH